MVCVMKTTESRLPGSRHACRLQAFCRTQEGEPKQRQSYRQKTQHMKCPPQHNPPVSHQHLQIRGRGSIGPITQAATALQPPPLMSDQTTRTIFFYPVTSLRLYPPIASMGYSFNRLAVSRQKRKRPTPVSPGFNAQF